MSISCHPPPPDLILLVIQVNSIVGFADCGKIIQSKSGTPALA
jgi:hypothetical protein